MSNNFPPIPVDGMKLTGVTYVITFPDSFTVTPASPLTFTGVSTSAQSWFSAGNWGVSFAFHVPGAPGSFDQAAAEAGMAAWLTATATAMSLVTGIPAHDIALSISVTRVWRWSDSGSGQSEWASPWAWTA
jgi:hypothetical protein